MENNRKQSTPCCLDLHGLCSSPGSNKRAFFRNRLAPSGVQVLAPDLNVPTFEELTLTAQMTSARGFIEEQICGRPAVLIGSSLGGLVSLLVANAHPELVKAMLLIAPATRFIGRRLPQLAGTDLAGWERTGYIELLHYADQRMHRLGFQLARDARQYDFQALEIACPTLIVHGTEDDVTSLALSEAFAASRPNVSLAPIPGGDHSLAEHLDKVWELSTAFLTTALE